VHSAVVGTVAEVGVADNVRRPSGRRQTINAFIIPWRLDIFIYSHHDTTAVGRQLLKPGDPGLESCEPTHDTLK
jgi:hypothetical protein